LAWRLRAAALVLTGAMAVHELRYLLGYEGSASRALSQQGHAYLGILTPLVGALLALALAEFCWRLTAPRRAGAPDAPPPFRACWAFAASALVVLYAVQESLEGIFENGHPDGLAGVFGHGGWLAIPLALAIGAVIALLLRGAAAVVAAVARRAPRLRRRSPGTLVFRERPFFAPRLAPLALCSAGRAPPRVSGPR
jgi:hypothetical protein